MRLSAHFFPKIRRPKPDTLWDEADLLKWPAVGCKCHCWPSVWQEGIDSAVLESKDEILGEIERKEREKE